MNIVKSQAELNLFGLLRDRKIIEILDGDTKLGEFSKDTLIEPISISMPYLSGRDLCSISNRFGLPASYSWSSSVKSRCVYLDELMEFCIKQDRMPDLLAYLFSKSQFKDKLRGYPADIADLAYDEIVHSILKEINDILFFSGNELTQKTGKFCIQKIGSNVTVNAPKIKEVIDRKYISQLSERALKNVDDGYYDSALTQSRTLLEEVFCYVIEKKNETPSDKGDIGKLYKQVKELYNMHNDSSMDRRINTLLSGLEKIVSSIAEMRNKASDAHGVGANRLNIADHHARLYVNASMTMADFILSVAEKQNT